MVQETQIKTHNLFVTINTIINNKLKFCVQLFRQPMETSGKRPEVSQKLFMSSFFYVFYLALHFAKTFIFHDIFKIVLFLLLVFVLLVLRFFFSDWLKKFGVCGIMFLGSRWCSFFFHQRLTHDSGKRRLSDSLKSSCSVFFQRINNKLFFIFRTFIANCLLNKKYSLKKSSFFFFLRETTLA